MTNAKISKRRLRLGMIGGGEGAYIGGIHRLASRLDNQFELVAGAFDAVAERGHAFAATAFIDPERSYDDFRRMVEREMRTPVLESMESQRNSRSRCTNWEVSANPADLQSSDMQSSTRSRSFTGFAGILKKVERLLEVKLKL